MRKSKLLLISTMLAAYALTGCSKDFPVDEALVESGTVYENVTGMEQLSSKDAAKVIEAYNDKYANIKKDSVSASVSGKVDASVPYQNASFNFGLTLQDDIQMNVTDNKLHNAATLDVFILGMNMKFDMDIYSENNEDGCVNYTYMQNPISDTEAKWIKSIDKTVAFDDCGILFPVGLPEEYVQSIYMDPNTKDYVMVLDANMIAKWTENNEKVKEKIAEEETIQSALNQLDGLDELDYGSIYMTLSNGLVLRGYHMDVSEMLEDVCDEILGDTIDADTDTEIDTDTNAETAELETEPETELSSSVKECYVKITYTSMNDGVSITIPEAALNAELETDTEAEISTNDFDYGFTSDETPSIENVSYASPEIFMNETFFVLPCKLSEFEKIGLKPVSDKLVDANWFDVVTMDSGDDSFLSVNVENLTNDSASCTDCIVTGISYSSESGSDPVNLSVFGISIGMDLTDVTELLGEGDKNYESGGCLLNEYMLENCHLSVTFIDDKVSAFELFTY